MLNRLVLNNLFFALIAAILALFFVALGSIAVLLPWFPKIRAELVEWLLTDTKGLSLFGLGFLMVGVIILTNLLLSMRKRYYHLRSGTRAIVLEEVVFQKNLETYLNKLFPRYQIPHQLTLKKNKIYIKASLPFIPQPQQKLLLERIRSDLEDLFGRVLGYRGEFFLAANFQAEKEKRL